MNGYPRKCVMCLPKEVVMHTKIERLAHNKAIHHQKLGSQNVGRQPKPHGRFRNYQFKT